MSKPRARRKPVARPPRLTPVAAASDLIRIAILEQPGEVRSVELLADDTTHQMTRRQAARTMVFLSLIARAFAAQLPDDVRADVVHKMESIMVDDAIVEFEVQLGSIEDGL